MSRFWGIPEMSAELLRFEDFELDGSAFQLRHGGRVVHLERIPLELLFLLVERRGQLVSREEIIARVWGKDVFIDMNSGINSAVRKLRVALQDDAEAPRFLAAVPAKGYRFLAKVRRASAGLSQERRSRSSLVGRGREIAELRTGLGDAVRSRGRLLLICGEPGIGKTRLTEELALLAQADRMAVAIGHCIEQDESLPYLPFVEILERLVDRARSRNYLRKRLGEEGPELTLLLPKLKRILPDLPPPLELSPQQARRHLFNCFCDFAARLARERALLLVLDDLHWADDSTLALLYHLAQRLSGLPILVVGTYRDAEVNVTGELAKTLEDLMRSGVASRVRLTGLGPDGVELMLTALSGQAPPAPVVREIHAETGGNPFFVVELFRHLEEEKRLYDKQGGFRADLKIAELEVPQSVRLVVGRRLAQHSDPTQKILATAAVIGRSFAFEVLEASARTDGLLAHLEEAEKAGVIFLHAENLRYEFSHELVRQAVLSGVSATRRRQLHLEVAEALERVYSDSLEDRYSELAYHYRLGGNAVKAIDYLVRAGGQAAARSAHTQAVFDFEAALNLIATLPTKGERDQRELAVLRALDPVLAATKGFASAPVERNLLRARDLCQRLGDQAQMLLVLCELSGSEQQRGRLRGGRELFLAEYVGSMIASAEDGGDPEIAASAEGQLGECQFWTGNFPKAQPHFERSLAHFGPSKIKIQWLTLPALNAGFLGFADRCNEGLSQATIRARTRLDLFWLALALSHQGWGYLLTGRPHAARLSAEEAIALSREHGFEERAAIGTCIRGIALTEEGALEDGIAAIRSRLPDLEAAGCGIFDCWFYSALAMACAKAQRTREAVDATGRAQAALERAGGESFYQAELHRTRGELILMAHADSTHAAEEAFRIALDIARRQEARLWELRATMSLARLLAKQRRRTQARAMLAEIYTWFTEGFGTADLKDAKALLDELNS
jgi:DNA-binding winged helix-turn-helix (wHTH) protein